jgi:hypothetical protein
MLPLETSTLLLCAALITVSLTLMALFKPARSQSKPDEARPALIKLVLVLVIMLAFVVNLDLLNPISTERNFIVLLPVMAIVLGCVTELLSQCGKFRWWLFTSILLIGSWSAVNLSRSYTLMSLKWAPQQNWKATAQFAIDNDSANKKIYYLRNSDSEETERVFNFYLKKLSDGKLSAERRYFSQVLTLPRPAILIFGQANQKDVNTILKENQLLTESVHYPVQSLGSTTGVILFP